MARRIRFSFALMGLLPLTVVGCEGLRQAIRSSNTESSASDKAAKFGEATAVDSDPTKVLAVDADAKNLKPFFSNNRRSGGWSSEAREVEGHLGVGP